MSSRKEIMMNNSFSVLMSVYAKENPVYLKHAIHSVFHQTLKPSELVLVKDGPLSEELEKVIASFDQKNLTIVALDQNVGLGEALRIGVCHCRYELIARMDSDDICDKNRFYLQVDYMSKNPSIDIVGGYIEEFKNTIGDLKMYRLVPLEDQEIKKRMLSRNPMNHVTVMFRRTSILKAGNYEALKYLEDYYLWVKMMNSDSKLANINKVLTYVRTGSGMYIRRGDKSYIDGWRKIQLQFYHREEITYIRYKLSMFKLKIFIYSPSIIRYFYYKLFLRIRKKGVKF